LKILITGGCGFLGSNLAQHAINRGHTVFIFDNLSRKGAAQNLEWLQQQGSFSFRKGDIRKQDEIAHIVKQIKPDTVFHLAGQVAMTVSIHNPQLDFEANTLGTVNVLEAVRLNAPKAAVLFSSTNKVYGDLEQYSYSETPTRYECLDKPDGFDETTPLNFHSPYGCSKGAADQYMLDYFRVYGIKTVVFRHSSMYGGRQFATHDQGWVGWFCQKAVEAKTSSLNKPFTISGSGKQVRDVLHADDMVRLYFQTVKNIDEVAGSVFNIGGGTENSLSLLELFQILEEKVGVKLRFSKLPPRRSDQRVFVADISRAKNLLGWEPKVNAEVGISRMVEWVSSLKA